MRGQVRGRNGGVGAGNYTRRTAITPGRSGCNTTPCWPLWRRAKAHRDACCTSGRLAREACVNQHHNISLTLGAAARTQALMIDTHAVRERVGSLQQCPHCVQPTCHGQSSHPCGAVTLAAQRGRTSNTRFSALIGSRRSLLWPRGAILLLITNPGYSQVVSSPAVCPSSALRCATCFCCCRACDDTRNRMRSRVLVDEKPER